VRWKVLAFGAAAAALLSATAALGGPQGDLPAGRGAVLFENRCARCHGVKGDGDGGLGPSLIGVLGRPAASRADYVYTDALKAAGGLWTAETLDTYLADPQAFAPGGEMDVNSPDPAERAAIIEHIATLK